MLHFHRFNSFNLVIQCAFCASFFSFSSLIWTFLFNFFGICKMCVHYLFVEWLTRRWSNRGMLSHLAQLPGLFKYYSDLHDSKCKLFTFFRGMLTFSRKLIFCGRLYSFLIVVNGIMQNAVYECIWDKSKASDARYLDNSN